MFRSMWCAMALAVAAFPAQAQDSLREEIRQLQQRLQQLEKRLEQTESTATQAAAQASSRPQTESALNPGVSVILNGVYGNFSRDPNTYRLNGFVPTMGEVAAGTRGLRRGGSELAFMAHIDNMVRGPRIASISPANRSIDLAGGHIQTAGRCHRLSIYGG